MLEPGQPFPDVAAMNAACSKTEWRDFNGQMQGPYQIQRLLYLLDPVSLDQYTFPTSTIGGARALHELARKIEWMVRYRQPGVRPLVQLSSIFMPTRHGGRMRPHFVVLDWIVPGGGGRGDLVHKPSPQLTGPKPVTPSKEMLAKAGLETVSEPSLAEEMSDSIPF